MTKLISLASLPHTRWAFDLDGVLAVKPPLSDKKWTNMSGPERQAYRSATLEWYRIAERLGVPDVAPTIVVSARKNTLDVIAATRDWMFGFDDLGMVPFYLLDKGRTVENAAAFKRDMVHEHNCDALVEDNMAVLKAMRRLQPACSLYYWDGTGADVPELVYASIL